MRGLVKIQDLVDLAKPPLGGLSAATSAGQRRSEYMELNVEEEDLEKNAQDTPDNPGEANIDLG